VRKTPRKKIPTSALSPRESDDTTIYITRLVGGSGKEAALIATNGGARWEEGGHAVFKEDVYVVFN